jgi:hypothetical protein
MDLMKGVMKQLGVFRQYFCLILTFWGGEKKKKDQLLTEYCNYFDSFANFREILVSKHTP